MVNMTSRKFKFHNRDNTIIIFKEKSGLKYAYQNQAAINIAKHTHNTWQKNRLYEEILEDTVQGKIIEEMFEDFISSINRGISYISYDDFRKDDFEKHAPIDGLIFRDGNNNVESCISRIVKDVEGNSFGKITEETRDFLRSQSIFTIEIKSSRIPDKDYPDTTKKFNDWKTQEEIISNLRKRDFLVYPKYTRNLGRDIHNFEQYLSFVKSSNSEFNAMSKDLFVNVLLTEEMKDKCDIYTRIFVDKAHTDNIIAYMLGYTLRECFFYEPRIINMPRLGKSENALYYVYPIAECNQVLDIFNDDRIWA